MAKKFFKIISCVFLVIGISLIILAFVIGQAVSIPVQREKKTTATITEITRHRGTDGEAEYDVFVEYEIDGTTYEKELNAYSSDFREGQEIEIIYDKDDPENITVTWIREIIYGTFGAIGGTFIFIGLIGVIITFHKRTDKKKKLMEKGELVYARFRAVEEEQNVYIGGMRPYRIVAEWTDPETGEEHILRSEFIYKDPRDKLEGRTISQIPVYMDWRNKNKYYMDISQILGE